MQLQKITELAGRNNVARLMSSTIRITKEFNFETGHALHGYDGLCKNVHGHSYKLSVTIKGQPINDPSHVKNGMVIDFSDLKKIVREEIVYPFDHATVLNISTQIKFARTLGQGMIYKHLVFLNQP